MSRTYVAATALPGTPAAAGFEAPLTLIGRVLLALMFVLSGFSKLTSLQATASFIASTGLPLATFIAAATGVFELAAGIALAVGWHARLAAIALGLFTLLASVIFHAYWKLPADQQLMQQLMFMKNVSVAGGLFFVGAVGAGRASVDARQLV